MSFSFSRSVHMYYLAVLALLVAALSFGIYFYWEKGPANIENITNIYEANLKIDEMKERSEVEAVSKAANTDRVREAVRLLDNLKGETQFLQNLAPVDSYEQLEKTLKATQSSLDQLLSYPEQSKVVLVFNNKVNNYNDLVESNNWRTLSRLSRRMQAKVSNEQIKSTDFFGHNKLQSLTRSLDQDVDRMVSVTKNSVLSNANKALILTNIESMRTELDMMKNYTQGLGAFQKNVAGLKDHYAKWVSEIEPAISLKRIEFERASRGILFAFIGLMAFILTSVFLGFWVYARSKRSAQRHWEKAMVQTIREGILPLEGDMPEGLSHDFQDEVEKFRSYIHKRMSFGTIFQEAMPFSSILLDSNLNVVWANSLFYEHWQMEVPKGIEEGLTWDFLQQFTNLGEDDPVLQAVKENLAGIYHVQIRKPQKEARPFEMYVSPVEYAGQKRIMIIFYPLASLEQTLADQTRSLVGPINRTLETLMGGQYNSDFKQKVEKDFDIAGIPHIHEKFIQYNQFVIQQKTGLLNEIERLEGHTEEQSQTLKNLKEEMRNQKVMQKEAMTFFNEVKEDVINIVDLRKKVEDIYHNTAHASKALLQEEMNLLNISKDVGELLEENTKAFKAVSCVRDDFKQLKSDLEHSRKHLLQRLDQILVSHRSDGTHGKVEEDLGDIKSEVRQFDELLQYFSKVSTQLDVALSKVSMILENNRPPELSNIEQHFQHSRDNIENDLHAVKLFIEDGEAKDEHIIYSLKKLFESFREETKILSEMGRVVEAQIQQNHEQVPVKLVSESDFSKASQMAQVYEGHDEDQESWEGREMGVEAESL